MNEGEVQKQIQQMINFIHQEAEEKAREIDEKAEEEFHMEKSQIVQAEKIKIMKEYEKKFKTIEVQRKTKIANMHQESRIQILRAQDEVLRHLLTVAEQHLPQLTAQSARYQKLLKNLILQGLLSIDEPNVAIQCRAEDAKIIQACGEEAAEAYRRKTSKALTCTYDPKHITCVGGAILLAKEGRIRVDNTLDTRLNLTFEGTLPASREMLFGLSANRKFFD